MYTQASQSVSRRVKKEVIGFAALARGPESPFRLRLNADAQGAALQANLVNLGNELKVMALDDPRLFPSSMATAMDEKLRETVSRFGQPISLMRLPRVGRKTPPCTPTIRPQIARAPSTPLVPSSTPGDLPEGAGAPLLGRLSPPLHQAQR